jgi:hypothetical protein
VFLASDAASGITGSFIHPDGGIGVKGLRSGRDPCHITIWARSVTTVVTLGAQITR